MEYPIENPATKTEWHPVEEVFSNIEKKSNQHYGPKSS